MASGGVPDPAAKRASSPVSVAIVPGVSREAFVARSNGRPGPIPAPGATATSDAPYTTNSAAPSARAPLGPTQAITGTDASRRKRPRDSARRPKSPLESI